MKTPIAIALLLSGTTILASAPASSYNIPLTPPAPVSTTQGRQNSPPNIPPQPAPPNPAPAAPPASNHEQPLNTNPATLETGLGYSLEVRDADDRRTEVHGIPFTLSYRLSGHSTVAVDGSVDIVRRHFHLDDSRRTKGYEAVRAGPRLDLAYKPFEARVFAVVGRDSLLFERKGLDSTSVSAGFDGTFDLSDNLALAARVSDRYNPDGNVFYVDAGVRKALSDRIALSPRAVHLREGPYGNDLTYGRLEVVYSGEGGSRLFIAAEAGQRFGGSLRLEVPLRRENDVVLRIEGGGQVDNGDTHVVRGGGFASLVFPMR